MFWCNFTFLQGSFTCSSKKIISGQRQDKQESLWQTEDVCFSPLSCLLAAWGSGMASPQVIKVCEVCQFCAVHTQTNILAAWLCVEGLVNEILTAHWEHGFLIWLHRSWEDRQVHSGEEERRGDEWWAQISEFDIVFCLELPIVSVGCAYDVITFFYSYKVFWYYYYWLL